MEAFTHFIAPPNKGLGSEGDNPKGPLDDMLSEENAKQKAADFGEGVTFEKIEPVTVGTSKGARATYRFADINKLRISTNGVLQKMNSKGGTTDDEDKAAPDGDKPIGFHLKKMAAMDQQDPATALATLKGMNGTKFETKDEATVKLK